MQLLEHFGFKHRPFRSDLFSSAADAENNAQYIAELREILSATDGFALLTGKPGSGKSELVQKLLPQLPGPAYRLTVPETPLSGTDFMRLMADAFKLKSAFKSRGAFILQMREHLVPKVAQDQSIVLVIESIQRLPKEFLKDIELLSTIQIRGRALFNFLFVGNEEAADLFADPSYEKLSQRIKARITLKSVSQEDTNLYIRECLRKAGADYRIFDESAEREIFRLSRGRLWVVAGICELALVNAHRRGLKEINANLVGEYAKQLGLPLKGGYDRKTFQLRVEVIRHGLERLGSMPDGLPQPAQTPAQEKDMPVASPDPPDAAESTDEAQHFRHDETAAAEKPIDLLNVVSLPPKSSFPADAATSRQQIDARKKTPPQGEPDDGLHKAESGDALRRHLDDVIGKKGMARQQGADPTTFGELLDLPERYATPKRRNRYKLLLQGALILSLVLAIGLSLVYWKSPSLLSHVPGWPLETIQDPRQTRPPEKPDDAAASLRPSDGQAGTAIPDQAGPAPSPGESKKPTPAARATAAEKQNGEWPKQAKVVIHFDYTSDSILPEQMVLLDWIAEYLKNHAEAKIILRGFSDNSGNPENRLSNSRYRALLVKLNLISKGVPPARIQSIGMADSHPVGSNKTLQGRIQNRRVEIELSGAKS